MIDKQNVLPDALYSAEEVMEILGFTRVETIYEISDDELVPTRVGPRRGRKMFRGRDLIAYMDAGRPSGSPPLYEVEAA